MKKLKLAVVAKRRKIVPCENLNNKSSGSWNLLVDKINSIVVVRILNILFTSWDALPNNEACVRTNLFLFNNFLTMLLMMLKSVRLSFLKKGKSRETIAVDWTSR